MIHISAFCILNNFAIVDIQQMDYPRLNCICYKSSEISVCRKQSWQFLPRHVAAIRHRCQITLKLQLRRVLIYSLHSFHIHKLSCWVIRTRLFCAATCRGNSYVYLGYYVAAEKRLTWILPLSLIWVVILYGGWPEPFLASGSQAQRVLLSLLARVTFLTVIQQSLAHSPHSHKSTFSRTQSLK